MTQNTKAARFVPLLLYNVLLQLYNELADTSCKEVLHGENDRGKN